MIEIVKNYENLCEKVTELEILHKGQDFKSEKIDNSIK